MIRLDQELMKNFEELTYSFQELIIKFKNQRKIEESRKFQESRKTARSCFSRFLKLFSILACYALYLNQESRKIPTCFRLVFLDS